ncbi:Cyclic pyranopterin monophosphate synthase [Botrimarina colliarenosi]|uniref:GTP 3',8-cyclase n=1 Tax=Botrimarina colliarenosi TaxID=2528001 RepID=A0A5C6AIW7_9BACT|nr:GTP 3',8-cyclase MoaA [Botrimarina colliarenosi]TWT98183.1 Cyclic pyranopterin monophosphate synthase [Botrimarina colliarenosi]
MRFGALTDRFGRRHTKLRVSVTDRCNLRCRYCMPAEGVPVAPRDELLTFEELERVVRIATELGVTQVRLTGGEPLVRKNLDVLVAKLAALPGVRDLALSTNAVLLAEQADALRAAGLQRVNISLDVLDPAAFKAITRRDDYDRVVAGIEAARGVGFDSIKVNVVSLRGVTEDQVVPFGNFARDTGLEVRFIEYMPLDASSEWERGRVLFAADIRRALEEAIQPLAPISEPTGSPATEYEFADGVGRIGFIPTVSQPFCATCDRFRLTADGKLRNCLFSHDEVDLRGPLREGADDAAIAALMQQAIAAKGPGHQINTDQFVQPARTMSAIGG